MLEMRLNKYYISEGCYINKVQSGNNTPLHTHDFLEIVYIFSGAGVHIINNEEYPVRAGDALFINLGDTHSFNVPDKISYVDIIIKPEFISESLKGVENAFALLDIEDFKTFSKTVDQTNRLLRFSMSERKEIENLILLALKEQENSLPGKELMLHSLINTLLTFVFRKMALPMKQSVGVGNELLEYIKNHCAEPITMEETAHRHHYNSAYFSRLFKKQTGHTFTEYLYACRIDLACKLLEDTELDVSDIVAEVGFSNRTKFYKEFSNRVGTTPRRYRQGKK